MQHHVDAPNSGVAQSRLFFFLHRTQTSAALQVIVKLLQITGGELIQRNISDSRNDMLFDISVAVVHGRRTDVRLRIELEPCPQPCDHLILDDVLSVVYTFLLTNGTEIELMCVQLSK